MEVMHHCVYCNHHKKKMSINRDKGVFQCFVCGKAGHISQLEDEFGWETDVIKKESISMLKPLHTRALSEETIAKSPILETADKLEFYLYDITTGQKTGVQTKTKAGSYYIDGTGYFVINDSVEQDSLYLYEGGEDAMSGYQYYDYKGTHLAMTGATKIKALFTKLKPILNRFKSIYLCLDMDEAGRKAEKGLYDLLSTSEYKGEIFSIEFPESCNDFNAMLMKEEEPNEIKDLRSYNSQIIHLKDCFTEVKDTLLNDAKSEGLPTTIRGIDRALGGGIRMGEIDALVAQAKTGKSSLFEQMLWIRAKAGGIGTGYLSREMRPSDVIMNLLSIEHEELVHRCKDNEKIETFMQAAADWNIKFSKGHGQMTLDQIKSFICESRDRFNVKDFYLDHFHKTLENSEDKEEIAKQIAGLSSLVKAEGVHLWMIIQPTKLGFDGRLNMDKMRGSVALQQEVDNIWILEREPEQEYINKLTLEAGRSKLCKVGKSIYLQYNPETARTTEVTL